MVFCTHLFARHCPRDTRTLGPKPACVLHVSSLVSNERGCVLSRLVTDPSDMPHPHGDGGRRHLSYVSGFSPRSSSAYCYPQRWSRYLGYFRMPPWLRRPSKGVPLHDLARLRPCHHLRSERWLALQFGRGSRQLLLLTLLSKHQLHRLQLFHHWSGLRRQRDGRPISQVHRLIRSGKPCKGAGKAQVYQSGGSSPYRKIGLNQSASSLYTLARSNNRDKTPKSGKKNIPAIFHSGGSGRHCKVRSSLLMLLRKHSEKRRRSFAIPVHWAPCPVKTKARRGDDGKLSSIPENEMDPWPSTTANARYFRCSRR